MPQAILPKPIAPASNPSPASAPNPVVISAIPVIILTTGLLNIALKTFPIFLKSLLNQEYPLGSIRLTGSLRT